MITGHTRAAGVIGTPIRHSLSPAIFNAAFAAAGLDWAYLAFDVPEGAAGLALGGMRALGLDGLSVTMPHKAAVLDGLDELSPDAEALGAVNCISRRGALLRGDNTDGPGLIDSLRVDDGIDVDGLRVRGGRRRGRRAGRSPGRWRPAGAAEVVVVNRSPEPAERAVALAGPVGPGRAGRRTSARPTSSSTPRRWAWGWSSPPPASPSRYRSTPSASVRGRSSSTSCTTRPSPRSSRPPGSGASRASTASGC